LKPLQIDVGPDVDIGPFVREYEKLQLPLKKSNLSVTRLFSKCENLANSIRQREKTYAYLCGAHEKNELKKKEILDELELNRQSKEEMLEKTEEKRKHVAEVMGKIKDLDQLLLIDSNDDIEAQKQEKTRLQVELDKLSALTAAKRDAVKNERIHNMELTNQLQTLHEERRNGQLEIDFWQSKITETNGIVSREKKRKEKTDADNEDIRNLIASKNNDVIDRRDNIKKSKSELNAARLKQQVETQTYEENHMQLNLLKEEVMKKQKDQKHLSSESNTTLQLLEQVSINHPL